MDGNRRIWKKSQPRIAQLDSHPLPPIPEDNYAVYMMRAMASHDGDKPSVIDAESGDYRTYSYLKENVPRVAGGLQSSGVQQGDVVMFLSPNHIDYQLLLLSVVYCGATFAPVNPDLQSGELHHMIKKSGARWAICHPSKLGNFMKARALLPRNTLQKVWVLEKQSNDSIYSLADHSPVNPVNIDNGLDFKKSVALILFSSGTTGLPKGVMLSHQNLLLSHAINKYLQGLLTPEQAAAGRKVYERPLLMMPMCHLFGFVITMGVLVSGSTVILLKRFGPKSFFEAIEKYKVTMCTLVPHLVNFLSKTPLYDQYDTSSILGFASGTAPLGEESTNSFTKKTGRALGSGYGLTETGGVTGNGGPLGFKAGSVGKVMPYIKIKVSPSELELILLSHKGISEAAVIGVPHERTGEAPRAYVVPVPGANLDAKQLHEYVKERVVPYKQVTGGIVFVDSLPRNLTGKLLRKKLQEEYKKTKSKL
ncbi:uncharacterized protein [Palaemon carinicauda]|uniref:uncharacterized protein isoform X3 n=1 Tax=Palaemon carinicauda TaxID=392227 RepID=UPI0035B69AEA